MDGVLTLPALDRLTWRPATARDLPALARLLAAIEAVDRTGEHYDESDIGDDLADPAVDAARDTLVAVDPDGEAWAYGALRGAATVRDVDRIWIDGGVHPALRGRGLGRRVLGWQDARAAELHRERHPKVPGEALVSVYESAPSRTALVQAAGYAKVRYFHDMERDLSTDLPTVRPAPDGLRVVPFDPRYDQAVLRAHREAFAGHWGSTPPDPVRWQHWYTGNRSFRPELSRLILDGDEVAAYLLTYFFAADAEATGVREAWVGQLGTREAWRRRGLASLLLVTALYAYREAGYQQAGLDVDSENPTGALGLYERLGFVLDRRWVTWSKALLP
ncbi:MAG: GNAT family N-acetyltransferase [Mycobacteriales bacterium]